MLEVEIKSLGPGPSFDIRDLSDNPLPVLDRFFGELTMLKNSLADFFFSILGPRTGTQATMNSTASFAFHSGTLTLASASSAC